MVTVPLYIIGDSPDLSGEWIVRTQFPRFIGRIVDDEAEETLEGTTLDLGTGEAVVIASWVDQPQSDEVMVALIDEMRQAIAEHEEALGV